MTSFLVTNGMHPEVLEHISEPTQLYISVVASDLETYEAVCQPTVPDGWGRLNRSLELMSSFTCRRVIRLTLVKGLNLKDAPGYAKFIEKAAPEFTGQWMQWRERWQGKRLTLENMPLHGEVREFSEALARETGYKLVDESKVSRVILLKG